MKMRKRWLWLLTVLVVPVGYAGIAMTGNLEPSGAPGSTMRTLEELQPSWNKKITDASMRFELVLDNEAVLDKETGLVWEKSPLADIAGKKWSNAVSYAYNKTVGGRKGWRLPTVEELASLVDTSVPGSPKLPSDHPFTNVQTDGGYWSSTTVADSTSDARGVSFNTGNLYSGGKDAFSYVWCVRGGHGHDAY